MPRFSDFLGGDDEPGDEADAARPSPEEILDRIAEQAERRREVNPLVGSGPDRAPSRAPDDGGEPAAAGDASPKRDRSAFARLAREHQDAEDVDERTRRLGLEALGPVDDDLLPRHR